MLLLFHKRRRSVLIIFTGNCNRWRMLKQNDHYILLSLYKRSSCQMEIPKIRQCRVDKFSDSIIICHKLARLFQEKESRCRFTSILRATATWNLKICKVLSDTKKDIKINCVIITDRNSRLYYFKKCSGQVVGAGK